MRNAEPSPQKVVDQATAAPEIEVTPEMMEAGLSILWESGAVEKPMEAPDRELVRRIYLAMARLAGCVPACHQKVSEHRPR